jgi:hypothetical protein
MKLWKPGERAEALRRVRREARGARREARGARREARGRDFQRSRVYEAERRAFGSDAGALTVLRRADAVRFVLDHAGAAIIEWSTRAQRSFASPGRRVRFACKGASGGATICTVIHETAHLIGAMNHGPHFCAVYLRLVRDTLGIKAAETLAREFLAGGVRFNSWR